MSGRQGNAPRPFGQLALTSGIGTETAADVADGLFRLPAPVRMDCNAVQGITKMARSEEGAEKGKALVDGFEGFAWIGGEAQHRGSAQLHEQGNAALGDIFHHAAVVVAIVDFQRPYFKRRPAN